MRNSCQRLAPKLKSFDLWLHSVLRTQLSARGSLGRYHSSTDWISGKMSANKIPARPMEYPYTLVSKFTHFPYKMYYNHANWRFKWSVIGYVASIPFFVFLNNALNSPGNIEKRKEFDRKIHKDHEEHLKHLW